MRLSATRSLRGLASLWGAQSTFINMHGVLQWASANALEAVISTFDPEFASDRDINSAIERRCRRSGLEIVPPVAVAWDGDTDAAVMKIAARDLASHGVSPRVHYTLTLDSGEIWSGYTRLEQARTLRTWRLGGDVYHAKALMPKGRLPLGYYRMVVESLGKQYESVVVSAPRRAHQSNADRSWGVFAPLYALRSDRNWGVGDWSDAQGIVSWMAGHGGAVFGTLPFLAAYLDMPCDISPYLPVSRLFWNELFIDITRLPELSLNPAAQDLVSSTDFQAALSQLRAGRLVDYREAMRLKRRVLTILSQSAFQSRGRRAEELWQFIESRPDAAEYARFRAVTESQGRTWNSWLLDEAHERESYEYHLYVQLVAEQQIQSFAQHCRNEGVAFYIDFPLGSHPQGYDAWKYRDLFASGHAVGAPPDPVFTTGQSWGFSPIRPDLQRQRGYDYFIACVRHHMRHASMLRIDHVMGLRRLYWIPAGLPKSEGVYVRYPIDEYVAILNLESHRHQVALVGEDLGIVPGSIRSRMATHGWSGMTVAHWELASNPDDAVRQIANRPATVASLNTHDMFPFAAFWNGLDVDVRERIGQLETEPAHLERWVRGELRARLTAMLIERGFPLAGEHDVKTSLEALLQLLAHSDARWLLINLEDLWLETGPQNIPGTVNEHPNWQQKFAVAIEQIVQDRNIESLLTCINHLRVEARP